MNILWVKPDGTLALTSIIDGSNPIELAQLLKDRGDIPTDWACASTNVTWPDTRMPFEAHRWDGHSIYVDASFLPVPASVTMRQARLALLQSGLLTQVNAAIANMPGAAGDAARITWEFAGDVQRNDTLLAQLAGALGLSDAQLDDLFRLAATL